MLTENLQELRDFTQERKFKKYRKNVTSSLRYSFKKEKFNIAKRITKLLEYMCTAEDPIVFKDEKISFLRTNINIPEIYKRKDLKKEYNLSKEYIFENFNNVCLDWKVLLEEGLSGRIERAKYLQSTAKNKKEREYLQNVIDSLCTLVQFADRYKNVAVAVGNNDVAKILTNVPKNKANNFWEALQSMRFVHSALYLMNHAHMGLGRFDQYMYPYYKTDIDNGTLTKEEAKNLLAEFFISLNKDTDLYFGVQQGDNGQSLMLGGCKTEDGSSAINELTYLVMEVSKDLKLIDPKINLRIDSNTPLNYDRFSSTIFNAHLGNCNLGIS